MGGILWSLLLNGSRQFDYTNHKNIVIIIVIVIHNRHQLDSGQTQRCSVSQANVIRCRYILSQLLTAYKYIRFVTSETHSYGNYTRLFHLHAGYKYVGFVSSEALSNGNHTHFQTCSFLTLPFHLFLYRQLAYISPLFLLLAVSKPSVRTGAWLGYINIEDCQRKLSFHVPTHVKCGRFGLHAVLTEISHCESF